MAAGRMSGWTRRRAGLGIGVVAAGLLELGRGEATATRKKKRCPRCRGTGPGGSCRTNRDCCATETGLACAPPHDGEPGLARCCGTRGYGCADDGDCCAGFVCHIDRCEVLAP